MHQVLVLRGSVDIDNEGFNFLKWGVACGGKQRTNEIHPIKDARQVTGARQMPELNGALRLNGNQIEAGVFLPITQPLQVGIQQGVNQGVSEGSFRPRHTEDVLIPVFTSIGIEQPLKHLIQEAHTLELLRGQILHIGMHMDRTPLTVVAFLRQLCLRKELRQSVSSNRERSRTSDELPPTAILVITQAVVSLAAHTGHIEFRGINANTLDFQFQAHQQGWISTRQGYCLARGKRLDRSQAQQLKDTHTATLKG